MAYIPVSYTHLDVYKRQVDGRAAMMEADVIVVAVLPQIVSVVAENIKKHAKEDCLLYTSRCV